MVDSVGADLRRMPWSETDSMKERVKFLLEWEKRWNEGEGTVNMSELCRVRGVSRQTGYKWVKRYREAGHDLRALEERSRRPKTSPHAIDDGLGDYVAAARKLHPRWGPRKLRAWLAERHPELDWPSASWMGEVLRRRGLTQPRRRRRRAVPSSQPFSAVTMANAVWCIDYKVSSAWWTASGATS
jgi:putative transposase